MACFIVPATEAVVTTIIEKKCKKAECKKEITDKVKIPFSQKLSWLNKMLWGGSALLAFEHLWHGEISPWFPFLTAMQNHKDMMQMFHEMSTVGVSMAVVVTIVWGGMVMISNLLENESGDESIKMEMNMKKMTGR